MPGPAPIMPIKPRIGAHEDRRVSDPAQDPLIEVVIEIPRGSFLKRGSSGQLDFVAPLPCPFNYGSVETLVGLDGDLLDAVVLGRRLPRGTRVRVRAFGAVGLTDRGMYDDKLICGPTRIGRRGQRLVTWFFAFYAKCKWVLNRIRGQGGRCACEGWGDARTAIGRAHRRDQIDWRGPTIPF